MSTKQATQYDLIVLGATGYTGKLCAEHITKNLPTNSKWAIAGRSHSKLAALIAELEAINRDRTKPGEFSHHFHNYKVLVSINKIRYRGHVSVLRGPSRPGQEDPGTDQHHRTVPSVQHPGHRSMCRNWHPLFGCNWGGTLGARDD